MPSGGDGRLWTDRVAWPSHSAPCHPAVARCELVSAGETVVVVAQLSSQLGATKNDQACRLVVKTGVSPSGRRQYVHRVVKYVRRV